MFQGETAITLDDKGRMALPSIYRDLVLKECNNVLVLTYNPFEQGCLWLFPVKAWEAVRDQVMVLPTAKEVHRNLQMKLVGAAANMELDSAGRMLLPQSQRHAAGLEKKAVLLGMGTRFELWSEQAHIAKVRETVLESQITTEMEDLRL